MSHGGGIDWPRDAGTDKVSTSSVNKRVWSAFLSALTDSYGDDSSPPSYVRDAQSVLSGLHSMPNSHWRHGYTQVLTSIAEIQASATPEEAVRMARRGLDALHDVMVCRGVSAGEAVLSERGAGGGANADEFHFSSLVVQGKNSPNDGSPKQFSLVIPSSNGVDEQRHDRELTGPAMKAQLEAWARYGCIEPSAAASAAAIADMADATSLTKNKVFVLLGATSELGPAKVLTRLGATVVAIARCGAKLQSLIRETRGQSGATLVVPVRHSGRQQHDNSQTVSTDEITAEEQEDMISKAGADLISDAPELARWVTSLHPGKQLVIACLAYLDGEKNVRAAVGMDLICEYVCKKRPDTALSFLVSPATAHVIPDEAALDAGKRYTDSPLLFRLLAGPRLGFRPQATTAPLPYNNLRVFSGLADVQGPNYALAKAAQQWRAMVARGDGHVVSANMAPAARTQNMVSHSKIAAALEGMQTFPPFVAFDPPTARTLMAALMLWDACTPESSANPKVPLQHPMCLFNENSVHGGVWRCPYDLSSMGVVSYLCGTFAKPGKRPEGSVATLPLASEDADLEKQDCGT